MPTRFCTILLAVILLLASAAHAAVTTRPVKPSLTDPEIKTFDSPHWIYINRDIVVDHAADFPADRHQLLLFIPGTGGKGPGPQAFNTLAADLGYHVVTLMYPDDIAASICAHDADPKSFENFRHAIIQGGHATCGENGKEISIERPECIENRLAKLLQFEQQKWPRENWGQFLNDDGSIKWDTIAVAGQSQGGGHAAFIGILHHVARVICFGSPKDYNQKLKSPAAWYSNKSATPKDRFFALNHHKDPNTCTPEQMLQNIKALGLDAFGPIAEVDTDTPPYHHSRILYTSYPHLDITGPDSKDAPIAHTAAINTKNAERFKPVWMYLLTEMDQN